jgi:hypothetical protein
MKINFLTPLQETIMKYHAIAIAFFGLTGLANSVSITPTYMSQTAKEIGSQLHYYSNPTVYVDQSACREGPPNAVACSPYIISVGSSFLQNQENTYGNYTAKMVVAHEWGHTIQFNYGIRLAAPYQELQADCTGGSFVKYASTNLGYRLFLESAVSSARAAADYSTHGTPAQRDYYTRWGYANGVVNCFNALPRA